MSAHLPTSVDVVVIGAGQAGLSAAYHLVRTGGGPAGIVVLDANARPGGAWQHRWPTMRVSDVHGIFGLPTHPVPAAPAEAAVRDVVPAYFADYEARFELPVRRPVAVAAVHDRPDGRLAVATDAGTWTTRALVNATGTWDRPFVPSYPGMADFAGRHLHTVDYQGAAELAGQHVVVVGGGHSAVQLLAEISEVASTTWVTRRAPRFRSETQLGPDEGRRAVALVEDRVRRGLPPTSVVDVTGLLLREQERAAQGRGVYRRQPMFERVTRDGVLWSDGRFQRAETIVWATGFRAALAHLAPLRLRESSGGIRMVGTRAARDPRVHLVGYGPSASTIGGNRAGRAAAVELRSWLADAAA